MNQLQISGRVIDVAQQVSRKGRAYVVVHLRLHEREHDPERRWRPQRPVILRVLTFGNVEVPQPGAQVIVWGHLASREFTSGRPETAIIADQIRAYTPEAEDLLRREVDAAPFG